MNGCLRWGSFVKKLRNDALQKVVASRMENTQMIT